MSRLKRILKRLAIGFAILVALLLILNGAYSWHTGRQLEQRLAKLRAAGEPTSFAELAPEPILPEQDAAVHLQRCRPELEAFANAEGRFTSTPMGIAIDERMEEGKEPTPEQIVALRDFLENYPNLLQSLQNAANCKDYASKLDFTLDDSEQLNEIVNHGPIANFRWAARFLRWKMVVLLAEERQEEATRVGLVILRLARHYGHEPIMINGLVAIAVRRIGAESLNLSIRKAAIPDELRQQLDQELALHDDPKWIEHVLKTERAINLSVSKSQFSDAWWLPWMERGFLVGTIDYHEQLLPIITQPWNKSRQAIQQLNSEISQQSYLPGVMLELLTPAIEATHVAFNRNTATLRCLRIVNALAAYAEANGHEAAGLDDLDLPAVVKIDPFSGQPLKLKWTDEGWVVYSVDQNGTDEGGEFKERADWGLGPLGYVGEE